MVFLDFSTSGWKEGAKEFFSSLAKTVLAAAITFVLARLGAYAVPASSAHAAEIVAGVGLARAVLTSLYKWVTTTSQVATTVVG